MLLRLSTAVNMYHKLRDVGRFGYRRDLDGLSAPSCGLVRAIQVFFAGCLPSKRSFQPTDIPRRTGKEKNEIDEGDG